MQLSFKKTIYSIEIILKAAYVFTDRAYIYLDENEDSYIVDLEGKKDFDLKNIQGEFKNELLAQILRKTIAEKTLGVRELIYQRAMSSSMLISESENSPPKDVEEVDYELDEILVDWFNGCE